jgi:hypothetical protein
MRDSRVQKLCPHCAKPLQQTRYGAPLGPLAIKIVDAVEQSGVVGISAADLLVTVYGRRSGSNADRLRSYLSNINRTFAAHGSPVSIASIRNAYRITARARA